MPIGYTGTGAAASERDAKLADEKRETVRGVRDGMSKAMSDAEIVWRGMAHGEARMAMTYAGQAAALVREVDDDSLRALVAAWKRAFDAINLTYDNGRTPPQ